MGQAGTDSETYHPPPEDACLSLACPVDLGTGLDRLYWRQTVYRGRVVSFSIEQHIRESASSDWVTVYRVDTSHGTIHAHIFTPDGEEGRRHLQNIPPRGWDVVDQAFVSHLDAMLDNWEERRRRWSR